MSRSDDLPSVMSPPELSLGDAEALLAGRQDGSAPSGYRGTADLLRRLTSAPTTAESDTSAAALTAALGALRDEVVSGGRAEVRDIRSHRGSRMVRVGAALSAGVMVLGGTAAAAATNSLPAPAQRVVASVLSDVGVSVPDDARSNSSHGSAPGSSAQDHLPATPAAQAHGVAGLTGLCHAFVNAGTDRGQSRFAALIDGHGGTTAGTAAFCKSLLAPTTSGPGASAGNSSSGHGSPNNGSGGPKPAGSSGGPPAQPGASGQHAGASTGHGSPPPSPPGSGRAEGHTRAGRSG